jgi:hypothetical protein
MNHTYQYPLRRCRMHLIWLVSTHYNMERDRQLTNKAHGKLTSCLSVVICTCTISRPTITHAHARYGRTDNITSSKSHSPIAGQSGYTCAWDRMTQQRCPSTNWAHTVRWQFMRTSTPLVLVLHHKTRNLCSSVYQLEYYHH